MQLLDSKQFRPEVLYIFPYYNDHPSVGKPHRHDFLELTVVIDGVTNYMIEGQTYPIYAGEVLLFNPHVLHGESQPADSHSFQLHIGIRNVVLPGLQADHFPFTKARVDLGDQKELFFNICNHLIEERDSHQIGQDVMIQSMVTELLCMLLRCVPKNEVNDHSFGNETQSDEKAVLVSKTIYYLEAHHTESISLSTIADFLHVSPAYLSRIFKDATDETPINYLIKIRLKKAKELMEDSGLTVKDAAASVGYDDAFHFSKLFKKYYGSAPSTFTQAS